MQAFYFGTLFYTGICGRIAAWTSCILEAQIDVLFTLVFANRPSSEFVAVVALWAV